MAVAADVDVEVGVVPSWGDSTAWALVVSAVVLVLVSTAGCPVRLAVPVVLVDDGWASASEAVLLSACPAFWGVAFEWRADAAGGVGESGTSAAAWLDAGFAGGVAAGWPVAGVLLAGPDVAGSMSTGPVVLPSLSEVGAEASADAAVVDCVAPSVDPAAEAAEPGGPGEDSDDAEELDDEPDESVDELEGSADATPYPVATAAPMPRATANPPTRPTYVAEFVMATSVGWAVTRAMPAITVGRRDIRLRPGESV